MIRPFPAGGPRAGTTVHIQPWTWDDPLRPPTPARPQEPALADTPSPVPPVTGPGADDADRAVLAGAEA